MTVDAATFTGGADGDPDADRSRRRADRRLLRRSGHEHYLHVRRRCRRDDLRRLKQRRLPVPAPGPDTFVASVVVTTAVSLAVDNEATPAIYPVLNNQFIAGPTTYTVNVPVAYTNAAPGPTADDRTAALSFRNRRRRRASPTRSGRETSPRATSSPNDDEFTADGNVVYTVNAVNVVKATNQATLMPAPRPTRRSRRVRSPTRSTRRPRWRRLQPAGLTYNTTTQQFTVIYNGVPVTYTVGAAGVTDNRHPANTFPATISGSSLTFTDTVCGVTFTFDAFGEQPVTAGFGYTNHFFVDVISGTTYYIDVADNRVEALSYLPETTRTASSPPTATPTSSITTTCSVVFPVISGANVNVGVATVGTDIFDRRGRRG